MYLLIFVTTQFMHDNQYCMAVVISRMSKYE